MNVLVTDGENRSSLAITRSLGKRGCNVFVTATTARSLASSSRFCGQGFVVSDPLRNGLDYIQEIFKLIEREKIDIIFPTTEQSIYQLNPKRGLLPKETLLACPSEEKMRAISDKSSLYRLAEKLQVPIPKTLYLAGAEDLPNVISKIDYYPVVVKPALSKIKVGDECISTIVKYATSKKDLENLYSSNNFLRYPSMIQEKVVGPGTGLFTLYDGNRHLALFSHRRLREKPPSGGVSVVSESVPLDEEMVESASRLLSAVGWSGVAMVEFKRDERDGKAKLMEINGRFWGSLQLAITCGVDFPRLLLDHLKGEGPISTVTEYRIGHKMKWFLGTLDHLLIRLRQSREALNLPPGSQTKWEAVSDFLKIREKDASFDVIDPDDLSPFWFEGRSYIRHLLNFKD
jgi:predicted ATP-grasp superfamily ATP-dependent carboligase